MAMRKMGKLMECIGLELAFVLIRSVRGARGRGVLGGIVCAAALLASPGAHARARDGSGAWRPDPRAINGSFAQPVGSAADRWLSATSGGYDVTAHLTDVGGAPLATGAQTFSGCGGGPSIRG